LPTASKTAPLTLPGRIPELDGLRGFAILLVVICHYIGIADHAPLGFWIDRMLCVLNAGWSGVDLFFVLSGFLIGGILLDARNSPQYFRAFYMRRVFRILPVYYLWILIFVFLVGVSVLFFPGRFPVTTKDFLQVPIQLFFLRNVFIGHMPIFAFIWFGVTWSLSVEEQFYLLAPPLIRFLSTYRLVLALFAAILFAPLLRFLLVHYSSPQGLGAAFFPMPCRADALAWGILLAVAWRNPAFRTFLENRRLLLQRILWLLLLGVAALLWWLARPFGLVTLTIGLSWLALFYSCLLLVVVSQTDGPLASVMRWRWLRLLGAGSYCIYIVHSAFNRLAHLILLHSTPRIYDLRGLGVTLLALFLTLGVAALSWRFFEQPLLRRGHTYSFEERPAARVPASISVLQPPVQQ